MTLLCFLLCTAIDVALSLCIFERYSSITVSYVTTTRPLILLEIFSYFRTYHRHHIRLLYPTRQACHR